MIIDKLNWKLNFAQPEAIDPEIFFKVFNAWIPDSPEIFVDVADYQHVHDGPLIFLYGHYVDYILDATHEELGFAGNRKRWSKNSTNQERLKQSLKEFLSYGLKLQEDALFSAASGFDAKTLSLTLNDRALNPNTPESFAALKQDLSPVLESVFGSGNIEILHRNESQQRLEVTVQIKSDWDLKSILGKL